MIQCLKNFEPLLQTAKSRAIHRLVNFNREWPVMPMFFRFPPVGL
jgi:hypothetical protein